ncbi:MAG: cytochrome c oxidase subunit 3 [Gammaproteobacteria bacterium]
MSEHPNKYYIPEQSKWPIIAAIGLFVTVIGAANFIQQSTDFVKNEGSLGLYLLIAGFLILVYMMIGWFRDTIKESLAGLNSKQMDTSYRMGMMWFIFSEVMFFGAFFGALFYTRLLTVPWLGGAGSNAMTHEVLWPTFQAMWPLVKTPDGTTLQAMGPWPLPFLNTALLITSGIFLSIAHHGIKTNARRTVVINLGISIVLGFTFLCVQAYEYYHAYHALGLTLHAGIYGSTFFLLTGFHGLHVTIGATLLLIMWCRILKGHFNPDNHFAFEAAAWYWHFVDVVWIFLFFVVYWL